jgi:NAD(P)H-flavin reductase
MRAGEVTKALHNLSVGDKVGIRAPMGNGFPVEQWKGKNILFVMGGIGSAALKATIEYILANRADYGKVSILYGATAPQNFTYQEDIKDWDARDDVELVLTIDKECAGWQCEVGLVPAILEKMNPDPTDTIAVLCGPPIMIKFSLMSFRKLGFSDEQTYTTLEKRMKCASASAAAATWGRSTCAWTARCSPWLSWRSCPTSCRGGHILLCFCWGRRKAPPLDLSHSHPHAPYDNVRGSRLPTRLLACL